jgi:CheY-like chemotaxis protein
MSFTHVKAFAKGCNEYLAKPIDFARLDELLNQYLPIS